MKIRLLMALGILATACTAKNEVSDLDVDRLEVKGKSADGTIGLNDKKEAVIREERSIQDELRVIDLTNTHLADEARRLLFDVKRCRKDLADPRLGGDGVVPPSTDLHGLEDQIATTETIGVDEESGELKVVRDTYLNDKLAAEKKKEKTYRQVIKLTGRHLEECEARMAVVRRKAGLPSERYQGNGYFTEDGTFVPAKPAEQDLDAGFEIKAKSQKKATEASE